MLNVNMHRIIYAFIILNRMALSNEYLTLKIPKNHSLDTTFTKLE